MINLNVGNLWTDSYLDKVIALNRTHADDGIQVKSMFGSISGLTPTARSSDRIPFLDWDSTAKYIYKAQSNGIAVRYTLNQSCIGSIQDFKKDWEDRLLATVAHLHEIGVHEWTVTSALLIGLLREVFPNDIIEVSTIAEISSLADAERWKSLGANGANVSTSVNRDFFVLRAINDVFTASILANEACLYRCPYRRDCYNLSSHDSWRGDQFFDNYPFKRCNVQRMAHPAEWLKSRMIMPQWMSIYQEKTGIKWFKIAYRTHPESVAMPILEAYMNQHFEGSYCEMWPTIARLGNTDEPTEETYISCEALDDAKFINRWVVGVDDCSRLLCGTGCTFCEKIYEKAKRSK